METRLENACIGAAVAVIHSVRRRDEYELAAPPKTAELFAHKAHCLDLMGKILSQAGKGVKK